MKNGTRIQAILLVVLLAMPVGLTAAAEGAVDPGRAARVEGAIVGGLNWLASRQIRDGKQAGSWPVGNPNYRPAVAALAGLAFLANGHLPNDGGVYGTNVAAALEYVLTAMANDGYIGRDDPDTGMYVHAIGTLFTLSCLGMQFDDTLEPKLAERCRHSLKVIIEAQSVSKIAALRGGWHYGPHMVESDISVTCWQMLALHAARQAGFEIEQSVLNAALTYLNSAFSILEPEAGKDKGSVAGGYFYPDRRPSGIPHHSCTALALLVTALHNFGDDYRTAASLTYLRRCSPTWDGPQYGGFFYVSAFEWSQGMFQVGGKDWNAFGESIATVLLDRQSGDGSWDYPPSNHSPEDMRGTGSSYPVAMAVLVLSIDKQFLPMFQRQSRLYDNSQTMDKPAKKPVEGSAGSAKSDGSKPELLVPESALLMPESAPIEQPELDQSQYQDIGGWEEEEEENVRRPIGSAIFK